MYRQYINLMGAGGGASTLWNGLQAYYTADNTPNDALGNYNGTLVNGATYGTGIINQGFFFDNINDYIQLPNDTFTETGNFTISQWIKPDTVNNDWFLHFGNYTSGTRRGILMYINSAGNLSVFLHNNGTSLGTLSGGAVTVSTWHHVVLTHTDGVDFKLYVNGSLVATLTTTLTIDYPTPCIQTIGKGDNATRPFGGIIDEIGLFNTTKTQLEVTELYNLGAGKQYPTGIDPFWNGVLSYFKANNTAYDEIAGYTGTLNNGTTYDTGIIDSAFSFDSSLVQSITTTSPSHIFSLDTTYNMWVKPSSLPGFCMFLYEPSGTQGPGIGLRSGGNLTFFRGSVNADAKSGVNLVTDVWQMVTIVYRPWAGYGTNNVDFYINGSLVASKPLSVAGVGGSPMYVGSNGASNGAYDGFIDEISIWDSALTSTKITELYNLGAGKQYPN